MSEDTKVLPTITTLSPENDVRMGMNDDGVLVTEELDQAAGQFLKELQAPEGEAPAPVEPAPAKPADIQPDKANTFITRLVEERSASQAQIQQLMGQVQQLTSLVGQQAAANIKQEDLPDYSELLLDKEKGPLFLQRVIDLSVDKRLSGLPQVINAMEQRNANAELQTFKAANPEILENGDIKPAIKSLMRTLVSERPSMTYEQALASIKEGLQSIAPKTATAATRAVETTPKLSVQQVQQLASQIRTEQGVSARAIGDRPILTPKDAFETAWTEVMGGQKTN